MRIDENAFEAEIAEWLEEHGGYRAGAADHFDPEVGLDTAELWELIGATVTRQLTYEALLGPAPALTW